MKSAEEFEAILRKLTAEAAKELRKKLREQSGQYFVKTYTVHAHYRKVPKRRRR